MSMLNRIIEKKEGICCMEKISDDKAERILSIYSRLKQGDTIQKMQEATRYKVSERTVQRDLTDIQNFLQNHGCETGEIQEIVFDRRVGGYRLESKACEQLEPKELLAVCKVLLESRALVKEEMFPIIHKLYKICGGENERKMVKELLGNEMYHYTELQHNKKLLDKLWTLERAVKEQRYIVIQYKKLKDSKEVTRRVKPVGIIFSEFYYYLTAFIEDIDREKEFHNPDDIFPTIYRVDRLGEITVLQEHFSVPYKDRFEEGEFRKRVQFMYGGKLRKVKLKCAKQSLEAVLDRLPTAEVVDEMENGEYIVTAEVFGEGINIWLKGQEQSITQIGECFR